MKRKRKTRLNIQAYRHLRREPFEADIMPDTFVDSGDELRFDARFLPPPGVEAGQFKGIELAEEIAINE